MPIEQSLHDFVTWWREHIKGDEKGEAQIFLDHLMRAFGHAGALEAGRYEKRIRRRRNGKTTVAFADYLVPERALIEMKKRGEVLSKHYVQLEEYWKSLPNRPRYALLCNFDEIWIYDFQTQFYDPVDVVRIDELPSERRNALSFLSSGHYRAPVFKNNRVEVTKDAAFQLAELFRSLESEVDTEIALRFTLQCMVALFAEDVGLLPEATLLNINARTNNFFQRLLQNWWLHMTGRVAMTNYLKTIPRYIACSRVTKRPVYDFVAHSIRPDSSLKVFGFDDDYSFGILQSDVHWQWFKEKASTLKADFRYTSHSVFDTFPFPQQPAPGRVKAVAGAGRALHEFRRARMASSEGLSLRDMLEQLLALNLEVAAKIDAGEQVTAPGIPPDYPKPAELVSDGCIQPPELF